MTTTFSRNLIVPFICTLYLLRALSSQAVSASESDVRDVTIPFARSNGTTLHLQALEVVPTSGGRHPLVVISHGSPRKAASRLLMSPSQYLNIATWFADRGFAVLVPMRRGYGKSDGKWVEGSGPCQAPRYDHAGLESARDIQAVIDYMRDQSFVDPQHIVLAGVSAGAWASLAEASQNPPASSLSLPSHPAAAPTHPIKSAPATIW